MPDQHSHFSGLAEVDWSQYRNALGAADDVPEMLQALSAGVLKSVEVSAAYPTGDIQQYAPLHNSCGPYGITALSILTLQKLVRSYCNFSRTGSILR